MLINYLNIPDRVFSRIKQRVKSLHPGQVKAVKAGLFDNKNLLICTPTASGKTLIAEMAFLNNVNYGKTLYIVPLKALASEKYALFKSLYPEYSISVSSGDLDSNDNYLSYSDLIVTVSEKFDSLLRHRVSWLNSIRVVVIDEIHLLNDPGRGPTLEVIITLLKSVLPDVQIIGLSATIGNPEELAEWLGAKLVVDTWRPVKLFKAVMLNNEVEFFE